MNRARSRSGGSMRLCRVAAAIASFMVAGCDGDPQKIETPVDPCTQQPCNVEAVVTQLGDAYRQRDYAHFSRLLHDDFLFILHPDVNPDPNLPPPPTDWGKTEELRIHRRMLEPQSIPTGERPLPMELWLTAVNITITPTEPLVERAEYYAGPSNPDGLNSMRWKAWGAAYSALVLFETRGDTDYQLASRQWFVIAEDLTKAPGDPGAFSLYRWQDLGGTGFGGADLPSTAVPQATWSNIKGLYM